MTVDAYVAQAKRICSDGQQKVYTAITTTLMGEAFPSAFPSDSFVRFYRQTHAIGVEVFDQLRALGVPVGEEQRRDTDLELLGSYVDYTTAAGRAAAGSDREAYRRLAAAGLPPRASNPLLPDDCLFLKLGPGAGT